MEDRHLFKAKRKDNQEWVRGSLVYTFTGTPYIVTEYDHIMNLIGMHKVDPTTICQCTGLNDKNGKLIWENDIIRTKVGTAKVIWDKSEWRIEWLKSDLWRKDLYYWAVEDNQKIEVIGNIFDNPESLESER